MIPIKKFMSTIIVTSCLITGASAYNDSNEINKLPFIDVAKSDWYFKPLEYLYSNKNIIKGTTNITFSPNNLTTHAEILTILSRLEDLNLDDTGQNWYEKVAEYYNTNYNIIVSNYLEPVTRRELCNYIVKIYGITLDEETDIFSDENNNITTTLYNLNIIKGRLDNDEYKFNGDCYITRAEIAQIIYNLITAKNNDKLVLDKENTLKIEDSDENNNNSNTEVEKIDTDEDELYKPYITYGYYDKLEDTYNKVMKNGLDNLEELHDIAGYMVYAGLDKLTYKINNKEINESTNTNTYIIDGLYMHKEFGSFIEKVGQSLSYRDGKMQITTNLTYKKSEENEIDTKEKVSKLMEKCEDELINLYNTKQLNNGMTNKEKAEVIYKYVCTNFEYDTTYTIREPYKMFVTGKGVCSGYTAIYNCMCRLQGIDIIGVNGIAGAPGQIQGSHAWSMINEEGNKYYVDVTWGDPVPDKIGRYDLEWFWKTEEEFKWHKAK